MSHSKSAIINHVQDNGDMQLLDLMMAVLRQVQRCHHMLATLTLLRELTKRVRLMPENVELFQLGLEIATELAHNSRSPKKAFEEVSLMITSMLMRHLPAAAQ